MTVCLAIMSFMNKALQAGVALLVSTVIYKLCFSPPSSVIHDPEDVYDFIIVGGGTSGSVLAAQLSEHYKVLLVEAGALFGWTAKIPMAAPFLQGTGNDWQYRTLPQRASSQGLVEATSLWPRGRGLGGSGQMNYLVHYGGSKDDWEAMEKVGVEGWRQSVMAHYMAKLSGKSYRKEHIQIFQQPCLEDRVVGCSTAHCHLNTSKLFLHPSASIATAQHPVVMSTISRTVARNKPSFYINKEHPAKNPLLHALIGASQELKHLRLLVAAGESTVRKGRRHNSLQSHLLPALNNPNLHLLLSTQVTRLSVSGRRVTGVKFMKRDRMRSVMARKEVIVCGGAIATPQLLQLSGIGPKSLLDQLGIPVVADVPVGNNLHDHLSVPVYFSLQQPVSITISKILRISEVVKYALFGRGLLGNSGVAGTVTDKESGLLLFGMGSTEEKLFRVISNYKSQVFNAIFPEHRNHSAEGFVFLASCLRPRSRGWVRIHSADPNVPPHIQPHYLHDQYDVNCTKHAIRLARRLVQTAPFKKLGAKMHLPVLDECLQYEPNVHDDDYLECLIRTVGMTSYHPAGTVSMGNLTDSVLDNAFRVKQLKGLRVVDASALPIPLLGAPNSVLIALAERAANLILAQANANQS